VLRLSDRDPIEHLILGYGFRHGSTTKIRAVHHAIGAKQQVQLSGAMVAEPNRHAAADPRSGVVILHNHPRNIINNLFDSLPLESNTDRKILKNMALNPVQICRRRSGAGRILFHLGEDGFVRDFRWPQLATILNAAGLILRY